MNKKYSIQEKQEIISRYLNGEKILSLSNATWISRSTIHVWIKEQKSLLLKKKHVDLKELHVLNIKCERQRQIIEILQNSPITPLAPLKERYEMIKSLSNKYNVNTLCFAYNVAHGSYYNHILRSKNENTTYAEKQSKMEELIGEIFFEFNKIFGPSKVQAILKYRGYAISQRMVSKLMRKNGWFSIRKNSKSLYLQEQKYNKENLIKQQFTVYNPNEVWVSDITYFSCLRKRFYICVILDLYSRKVIAHTVSRKNTTHLTNMTLKKAIEKRSPLKDLIFHTDQGSNYTSERFRFTLKKYNIRQSLSSRGNPYDNSVIESFFKTLKCEKLYRESFTSETNFKKKVYNYIEFYNTKRPHKFIGNYTPDSFEKKYYQLKSNEIKK